MKNKSTIVIGAGNVGAKMALTLSYWTQDLIYINHEQKEISEHLLNEFKVHRIHYVEETIQKVMAENFYLQGFILQSGKKIMGERGFYAFGGMK